jgi:hypothetical protein
MVPEATSTDFGCVNDDAVTEVDACVVDTTPAESLGDRGDMRQAQSLPKS